MHVSWSEHVGEIEMRLDAEDEAGVLRAAVDALAELLGDEERAGAGPIERREVCAEGADRPALLAAWLEELNYLAESERLIPLDVADLRLEPERVRADVRFRRGEPPHLVKAVTYHRLVFEASDGRWVASAVLDV
jgi:SHS2 domain-containing protein